MKSLINLGLGLAFSAALASAGLVTIAGGTTCCSYAPASTAAPVGGTVVPGGTASGAYAYGGIGTPDIAGTYSETVYSGIAANTYGGDTFVLTVTDTGGTANIETLSMGGFTGVTLAANYETGSAQTPVYASFVSGVVDFGDFNLAPGNVETVVLYTDYTGPLTTDNLGIINSYALNGQGVSPGPEPMSLSLLGGGLALLGALRFRAKRS